MTQIEIIKKKSLKKKIDPLKQQKHIWLAGHSMALAFGGLFALTYAFHVILFFKYRSWKWLFLKMNKNYHFVSGHRWYHAILRCLPHTFYRLSLCGTIAALSVTMHQNWLNVNPQWYEMLASENCQTLLMAALWLFVGRASFYRLFPYLILSYLHVSNYKAELQGTAHTEEVTKKNAKLLRLLAYSELFVILALVLDSLLLKDGTSGLCLVVYLGFYWLRINFSPYAQATVLVVIDHFDKRVPPQYREQWNNIKDFIEAKNKAREERKEKIRKTA
ncbi:YGR026W [Zygosaccharomyces parabailii]|nr:YGR026W [Zygosaccharomyces parabailii]